MRLRRRGWAPYLLLAPSVLYLALFFAAPMVQSFGLAFQDPQGNWSLASIQAMVGDPRFREALLTTLALIVLILPLQFAVAMAMALVVNARLKGSDLWLYVFALPLGISELAAGILWFAIFTQQGWLNSILQQRELIDQPVVWLDFERQWLLIVAVVIAEAWRATSIIMMLLVAGLQSVSRDYLEAADVYGATPWRRLREVVLPLLRPTIRIALILRAVLAFQVFAAVIAITGRGLTVLANEAYRSYVTLREPRVAAAYAALILLLSVVSTALFFVLLPAKEEQYS
jgi:multiple sugar transport system permease protein